MFRFTLLSICASLVWGWPTNRTEIFRQLRDLGLRIINGDSPSAGLIPWQVALIVNRDDGSWFCGGSIISEEWILTAGHCVLGGRSGTVFYGSLQATAGRRSDVAELVPHERYQDGNDIGLIRLRRRISFDDKTRPIALSSDPLPADVAVQASGWGATSDSGSDSDVLKYVNLRTISNEECGQYYGPVNDQVVCATADNDQVESTCSGDSGGPLVANADSNPILVAVVSFGSSAGCKSGAPSGYYRTAYYRDWIRDNTGV